MRLGAGSSVVNSHSMTGLGQLEEIGHVFGNIYQALEGVTYNFRKLTPQQRARKVRNITTRLNAMVESLREITEPQNPTRCRRMSHQDLVCALVQFADEAELLSHSAVKVKDLPDPIRAGILDRITQLASLMRLLANQINQLDPNAKPLNVAIDA